MVEFIHVDNVVLAHCLAAEALSTGNNSTVVSVLFLFSLLLPLRCIFTVKKLLSTWFALRRYLQLLNTIRCICSIMGPSRVLHKVMYNNSCIHMYMTTIIVSP